MHSENDQDFKIMVFEIDNNKTAIAGDNKLVTAAASRNQTPMPNKRSMIYPSASLPSPSSSSSLIKRGPLLQRRRSSMSVDSTGCAGPFAELAGGTTAECAAVCCCCPCGLAHLLYLTIYKVPAGLCRRALRRKRSKKLIEKGLLPPRTKRCYCDFDDIEIHMHSDMKSEEEMSSEEDGEEEEAMMKLEEEMWETFYNAGFWRSPSQREQQPKILIIESPKASKVVKQL
ncbi:uncharacterized protein [Euphorbia lathyris]|uniref:uncharacterized protein n=1 Tax=Euphorbia lathyris TaxID=212925 RepID=UPI0033133166